ncbi:protein timeless isoform X2 [Cimex lectularius]|uniref:Timeless n=1 Tax=Cimex lectularius TaxID=79782 RepID=A0A8I6SAF3_CIMLE|nr:protein timeless isoform X2 [Cimex lectularius]
MEWLVTNIPQVSNNFASLGSQVGDQYLISPECQNILDEVLQKLSLEDRTLRTFRRAIGFSQIIKKDLLPLLINVKDERNITNTTLKILANLTTPVECLLPIEVMSKTEAGRNTIIELNWLLFSCKEIFLDPRSTRRIIDHIRDIMEKGDKMTQVDNESLKDSMVLLRNILHIPDLRMSSNGSSHQNQILWNLFAQNIDKILIDLMTGTNHGEWRLAMVQLVSLLYKDQHVATLQKLLNTWFETSVMSESSEDNESNTSPPERGSGDSSSMVTSDPTSDSSDNSISDRKNDGEFKGQKMVHNSTKKGQTGGRKQSTKQQNSKKNEQFSETKTIRRSDDSKLECTSSEVSDCGYGTQVENQESVSTSSNEEDSPNRGVKPVHQKPGNMLQKSRFKDGKPTLTPQEKEEMRRKKLMKRSRTNVVNMKALLHHTPTDEDISQLLKEFTVDFLLKGYSSLVSDLREQLLYNSQVNLYIDTSHFFWLVTYFLKFAVQLEIDLEHISSVLSFKIVSFLTFEGVGLCEQFELTKLHSEYDMAPCLRRTHLVVTAIRELIQTINSYKKIKHLNDNDKQKLTKLQRQICETEELRCLFVLLLRQFNPSLHSIQYLQDVIVTNHLLLSFIESCSLPNISTILQKHMRQFVAVDMMKQYGHLLECFQQNGQFVNDCVFTMMHHVAGDLECVTVLFQPNILKTFSQIWETDFELCDDWSDLIEYVIHKFINMPRTISIVPEKKDTSNTTVPALKVQEWSQEDCDCLYWYYVQSANGRDPVGDVIKLYSASGVTNKTRIGVIEQLLKQDVITGIQYNELMEKEPITITDLPSNLFQSGAASKDEIELLKDHLKRENKFSFVIWVQKVLLEACHAKLSMMNKSRHIVEPVPYYCTLLQEPIPVVAWSCEQCSIMQSQAFLLLLHKLGLHLPADAGKVFARIPQSWSPDTLYSIACKLGPLQPDWVKFNVADLIEIKKNKEMQQHSFTAGTEHSPPYISCTPRPNSSTSWSNEFANINMEYETTMNSPE